jgi:hypothetical protein
LTQSAGLIFFVSFFYQEKKENRDFQAIDIESVLFNFIRSFELVAFTSADSVLVSK